LEIFTKLREKKMAKYRVMMTTTASASIVVEVPDELNEHYDIEEKAIELAFDEAPSICAQCSGWGKKYSMDLGEWDVDPDEEFDGKVYKAVELIEE
jgi:hypothetical protein